MQNNDSNKYIEEDEIDLRELFATIGRYKWSIILFTFLITLGVAVKVYFMPKYYKSSVTIEVKAEEEQAGGFSMGGAAALLLGGAGGGSPELEKDIALMKTYKINKKILDKLNPYMVRYFITDEKHKEVELEENLSIEVSDVKIPDFKNYGMRLIVKPLSKTEYELYSPTIFSQELIGKFHYSEMVTQEDFSLMIHKKKEFTKPYVIQLSGTKRYVFENIITPNLSIEADKESPFIIISFLDNLPHRAEKYIKNLIEIYTKQSINSIREDAQVTITSYNEQIQKIEKKVLSSSKRLERFKSKHKIIAPELQAGALVEELSKVGIEIAQNSYKQNLLDGLIRFTSKHNNLDAIAPSLMELQDKPTIELIKLIQEQQLAMNELLIKYKPNHPTIVRAEQTIYNLKSKVASNLKNLKTTLKEKQKSLKKMEKSYQVKLQKAPKEEQELISFSRDYKVNEKMYLYLMQEKAAAQLKHDKARSRFRIIEDIYTPYKAEKPKKALIVIVAFISSLILMVFVAFFREFLKSDSKEKKEDE